MSTRRQKQCEEALPIPLFREHPARILKAEIALILAKAPLLLTIFSPFRVSAGVVPPASAGKGSYGGVWLQVALLLTSVICIGAIISSLIFGPSLLFIFTVALTYVVFQTQAKHLQGLRVVHSDPGLIKKPGTTDDEAWLVINGICTGEIISMANFLSEAFQRPITGVHNRTGGFLFDLFECIVQRDFTYITQDGTTELYRRLKGALMDPKKKKVVLLCHSQGAIIVSLILDFLLADLPQTFISKLEIYTFGAAANHFNSPVTLPGVDGRPGEPIVKHVEHFANNEFVAAIGVLNWQVEPGRGLAAAQNDGNDTRFYGSLFRRDNFTGHLLTEHYFGYKLDPSADWPVLSTDGRPCRLWQYLGGRSPA